MNNKQFMMIKNVLIKILFTNRNIQLVINYMQTKKLKDIKSIKKRSYRYYTNLLGYGHILNRQVYNICLIYTLNLSEGGDILL